jgi:hypothetical protein
MSAGNLILLAFLVAQGLDGLFTYVGVAEHGIGIEGNPIIAALMTHLGHEVGLIAAKAVAAGLGICLHLQQVHGVVAALTGVYAAIAVAPWMVILFF